MTELTVPYPEARKPHPEKYLRAEKYTRRRGGEGVQVATSEGKI